MTESISDASIRATRHINDLNSSLTPQERSERARVAGVASGRARRKKRQMKDVLADLLTVELPEDLVDVRCQLQGLGLDADLNTALCYSILCRAIKGDVEAARWVRDTSGNKLSENLNISRTDEIPFSKLDLSTLSTEELQRMLAETSE